MIYIALLFLTWAVAMAVWAFFMVRYDRSRCSNYPCKQRITPRRKRGQQFFCSVACRDEAEMRWLKARTFAMAQKLKNVPVKAIPPSDDVEV